MAPVKSTAEIAVLNAAPLIPKRGISSMFSTMVTTTSISNITAPCQGLEV